MLSIPPTQFRKQRRRAKSRAAAAPPLVNQIVSVDRVEGEILQIVVTLSTAAADIGIPGSFQVWALGEYVEPDSVDLTDPIHPRFLFHQAVDQAEQWNVIDAAQWTMQNGQPLAEPYDGDVG